MDTTDLKDDPLALLRDWLEAAREALPDTFNAMALASTGTEGRPSVRVVLLKDLSAGGLAFFTNYHSRKAVELDAAGFCAVVFHWPSLGRQVRVEGAVARVPGGESDAYFATRDRGSQLGAWASEQSRSLTSRASLESAVAACAVRFRDQPVPRPPHWGGYRITPEMIEFWEAGADRLHDRFRYRRGGPDGGWHVERLAP